MWLLSVNSGWEKIVQLNDGIVRWSESYLWCLLHMYVVVGGCPISKRVLCCSVLGTYCLRISLHLEVMSSVFQQTSYSFLKKRPGQVSRKLSFLCYKIGCSNMRALVSQKLEVWLFWKFWKVTCAALLGRMCSFFLIDKAALVAEWLQHSI